MFKKINWKNTFTTASIAAIIFSVCAFIFINKENYESSWILYVGSLLFFFTVAIASVIDNQKRSNNESTVALVFASLVTTAVGIILSCVCCFIILLLTDPGILSAGPAEKIIQNNPPASITGKTDGLVFKIFVAATVINFCGGSIAAITMPFYSKRNQTKDNGEPVPLKQRELEKNELPHN